MRGFKTKRAKDPVCHSMIWEREGQSSRLFPPVRKKRTQDNYLYAIRVGECESEWDGALGSL
jgi:hypothetical protein